MARIEVERIPTSRRGFWGWIVGIAVLLILFWFIFNVVN